MKPFEVPSVLGSLVETYPSVESIINVLEIDDKDARYALARLWLSEGIPYCFKSKPGVYESLRTWLSRQLQVRAKEITIVGSGRQGFCLSPGTNIGQVFGEHSDLDLTIISAPLFRQLEETFKQWRADYFGGIVSPRSEQEGEFWEANVESVISKMMGDKKLSDFYDQNIKPQELEDVNYKLITNKDGRYAWRPLQLIHPAFYVHLVYLITAKNNWKQIKSRMNKLIKDSRNIECEGLPVVSTYYKKDKAAQIVHWSTEVEKKSIVNSLEFDYLFHTDIIDCYSSIYTHTIPWALHDKVKAKKEKGNKKLVGNLIDWQLQGMSSGQTNGIPQGSVLMDFLAEIVLCYIDSLLSEKINSLKKSDYKIIRYRDDYRIFTNNPQIAEQIIKELTDILNDFGMKINSSKTKGLNNVVHSSIKPDKLEWIVNENTYNDLQSELYAISVFSEKFPNSGTVAVLLKNLYDKVSQLTKKDKKGNIKVLISIATDIAYKNPRTYPIIAAILSKLIDFLPKREKEQVVKKILNKFKKLPNTGIMQLWLQRVTIKIGNGYEYSERLCNKVVNKNTVVWNSDWLNTKLKKTINSYNLVNEDTLKKLGVVISNEEVELFKIAEYPY